MPTRIKEHLSQAAYHLAIHLDGFEGKIITDPLEAIKYYTIAAKLNNPYALHNLAYSYQEGENVDQDLPRAKKYYARASNLGYIDSRLALAQLLVTEGNLHAAIQLCLPAQENPVVSHQLGIYHFLLHLKNHPDAQTSSQTSSPVHSNSTEDAIKTALHYYQKAAALGSYISYHSLGLLHYYGYEGAQNNTLAQQNFQLAAQYGIKEAEQYLIILYFDNFCNEQDPILAAQHKKTLLELYNKNHDGAPHDEAQQELYLKTLKLKLQQRERKIKQLILGIAQDDGLEKTNRIQQLLTKSLEKITPTMLALLIQQLGKLTEKTLANKDFHDAQHSSILDLLTKAMFWLNQFNTNQRLQLIEGVSKLHFSGHVLQATTLLSSLYNNIHTERQTLTPQQLVSAVFATVHLDPTLPVFNTNLLELIQLTLQKIITAVTTPNTRLMANLLYSLAVLDNGVPQLFMPTNHALLKDKHFHTAIQKIINDLTIEQQTTHETNWLSLHQTYMAIYYFKHRYPDAIQLPTDLLSTWKLQLENRPTQITCSYFQDDVIDFLMDYFPDCKTEEMINTLNVDGTLIIDGTTIVVQANGPSHYYRQTTSETDEPTPTLKTQFHNTLVIAEGCKVITVPYFKMQQATEAEQQEFYSAELTKLHFSLGEKWRTATNKKSNAISHQKILAMQWQQRREITDTSTTKNVSSNNANLIESKGHLVQP